MKTLYPVDEETYERIGKAYLICSQYPEVFGDVKLRDFCSLFVELEDEDASEEETFDARVKAYALDMYSLLNNLLYEVKHGSLSDPDYVEQVKEDVGGLLSEIAGEEVIDDE